MRQPIFKRRKCFEEHFAPIVERFIAYAMRQHPFEKLLELQVTRPRAFPPRTNRKVHVLREFILGQAEQVAIEARNSRSKLSVLGLQSSPFALEVLWAEERGARDFDGFAGSVQPSHARVAMPFEVQYQPLHRGVFERLTIRRKVIECPFKLHTIRFRRKQHSVERWPNRSTSRARAKLFALLSRGATCLNRPTRFDRLPYCLLCRKDNPASEIQGETTSKRHAQA